MKRHEVRARRACGVPELLSEPQEMLRSIAASAGDNEMRRQVDFVRCFPPTLLGFVTSRALDARRRNKPLPGRSA